MKYETEKPFQSIESAHEFISLLHDSVTEARRDIETDIENAAADRPSRRTEAMRVASVHLHNLEHHIVRTKRILNDLRSLRRLLFDERAAVRQAQKVIAAMPTPVVPEPRLSASTARAIRAMARAAG